MKKEYLTLILLVSAFAVIVCVVGLSVLRAAPGRSDENFSDEISARDPHITDEPHTPAATDEPSGTEPSTESETPDTEPPTPEFTSGSLHIVGEYTPSDGALAEFNRAVAEFGRPTGIYAVDMTTGLTISYNGDERFAPASIVKVVYALYCCRQVDAGNASLDEMLTYEQQDYINGNGTIGKMGVGAKLPLRDVLRYVIRTSDNEGFYMLIRRFGRSGCDQMTSALGCTSCRFSSSRWPEITPRDYAIVWQEIFRYKDESDTGAMLYDLLINVDYMHFFRDALGVTVANKSGWNESSYNEGGVVYGDRVYVLVVLTSGSYYTADRNEYNDIVRAVDAMIKEYGATFE